MAVTRPSFTNQLTSSMDVFEHVCGQKCVDKRRTLRSNSV